MEKISFYQAYRRGGKLCRKCKGRKKCFRNIFIRWEKSKTTPKCSKCRGSLGRLYLNAKILGKIKQLSELMKYEGEKIAETIFMQKVLPEVEEEKEEEEEVEVKVREEIKEKKEVKLEKVKEEQTEKEDSSTTQMGDLYINKDHTYSETARDAPHEQQEGNLCAMFQQEEKTKVNTTFPIWETNTPENQLDVSNPMVTQYTEQELFLMLEDAMKDYIPLTEQEQEIVKDIEKQTIKETEDEIKPYDDVTKRIETFKEWICPFISAEEMAGAGFYYTGYQDRVRCFKCGIEIYDWQKGDIPLEQHVKGSRGCFFLADERHIDTAEHPEGEDTCGIYKDETLETMFKTCKICHIKEIKIVFIPCGHLTCCEECADNVRSAGNRCPSCEQLITWSHRVILM